MLLTIGMFVIAVASPPQDGLSVLLGRVCDDTTGAPTSGVTVVLSGSPGLRRQVVTDRDGQFAFTGVIAGAYSVTVSGSRRLTTTVRYSMKRGETRHVVVYSQGLFAVSGQIVDKGEALVGWIVQVFRYIDLGGSYQFAPQESTTTDDKGEYRLLLPSGDYLLGIAAEPLGSSARSGPVVFYPGGAGVATAAVISIRDSDARIDVAIDAEQLEEAGSIAGTVGVAGAILTLTERAAELRRLGGQPRRTVADSSGSFVFRHVLPGEYTVEATMFSSDARGRILEITGSTIRYVAGGSPDSLSPRALPAAPVGMKSGRVSIVVGSAGIANIVVPIRTAPVIRGRVVFQGGSPAPRGDALATRPIFAVRADALASSQPSGRIEADGAFSTAGLPIGDYVLFSPQIGNWTVRSVVIADEDCTGKAIHIVDSDVSNVVVTYTDRPASVGGIVRRPDSAPGVRTYVYFFPEQRNEWANVGPFPLKIRRVEVSPENTFLIEDVIPGEYYLAAIQTNGSRLGLTPDNLAAIQAHAEQVFVAEGGQLHVSLAVAFVSRGVGTRAARVPARTQIGLESERSISSAAPFSRPENHEPASGVQHRTAVWKPR